MQIHEITLREAEQLQDPDIGAGVFGKMAQQLAPGQTTTPRPATATPSAPTRSSTGGTITPSTTGMVHTASERNPNPRTEPFTAQQKWDIEYRKLRNQFPGRSEAEYQQAMQSRTGLRARPGGGAAPRTPSATLSTQPTPSRPTATPAATAPVYPPITLGTGPGAQVFVNKGQGYVDSKTGKPMPPSIVKALGV